VSYNVPQDDLKCLSKHSEPAQRPNSSIAGLFEANILTNILLRFRAVKYCAANNSEAAPPTRRAPGSGMPSRVEALYNEQNA
jgi:hypothetical protein